MTRKRKIGLFQYVLTPSERDATESIVKGNSYSGARKETIGDKSVLTFYYPNGMEAGKFTSNEKFSRMDEGKYYTIDDMGLEK